LNEPLTSTYRSNSFDLIHSRCVGPGIKKSRWSSYIRDLARLLRRGGWVQMVEYYYNIQSDSGRLTDNHAMHRWGVTYRRTMEYIDRDPRIGRSLADKLRNAGLHDVHARTFQMPIGPWPTGEYDIIPVLEHICYCRQSILAEKRSIALSTLFCTQFGTFVQTWRALVLAHLADH